MSDKIRGIHPPNAVTTRFDCKIDFLRRHPDISLDADDWSSPAGNAVTLGKEMFEVYVSVLNRNIT